MHESPSEKEPKPKQEKEDSSKQMNAVQGTTKRRRKKGGCGCDKKR